MRAEPVGRTWARTESHCSGDPLVYRNFSVSGQLFPSFMKSGEHELLEERSPADIDVGCQKDKLNF
jgi:hypothetical protein